MDNQKLKLNYTTLLDVYCKEVRSILEHAVPDLQENKQHKLKEFRKQHLK